MARMHWLLAGALGVAAALSATSCYVGRGTMTEPLDPADAGVSPPPIPFEAVPPAVYVAHVKDILVGLGPTDDEVQAVTDDPGALPGLIDQWTTRPEYREKMLAFFANAFQQIQIEDTTLASVIPKAGGLGTNPVLSALLLQNMRESFARTVWELLSQGRPFNEAMTTRQFMLTPPLMSLYALIDELHVDDNGKTIDHVVQQNPQFAFTVESSQGPIPIAQSLDPQSPNYMHWYDPDVGSAKLEAGCQQDPRVYSGDSHALYRLIFGSLAALKVNGVSCNPVAGTAKSGQVTVDEFSQWKMVSIRPPNAGEETTSFYDLPKLRAGSELVLRVPRIGFFGTPAFEGNWSTNGSNQARVTMNQTLIVALGHSFDGSQSITPVSETGLDGEHAAPGTVCYGCHQTLDPMRQFFRQAYTISYHEQTDPAERAKNGVFAFDGVTAEGHGIGDLADQLAAHPRLAAAWAQKLCYYATSAPCAWDDPEFLRVAALFRASGFSWNGLVRELFSSPLVTHASDTKSADETGVVVPIARQEHLCASLSNRLGLADACGIGGELAPAPAQVAAKKIATQLPADGYSRGSEVPVLANDPTLFFRAGVENLCILLADQVVDAPGAQGKSRYASADPDGAIADFVHTVMALTTKDSRAAEAQAILHDHFVAAQTNGATPSDALKSTFVLACMAPSSVAIGM